MTSVAQLNGINLNNNNNNSSPTSSPEQSPMSFGSVDRYSNSGTASYAPAAVGSSRRDNSISLNGVNPTTTSAVAADAVATSRNSAGVRGSSTSPATAASGGLGNNNNNNNNTTTEEEEPISPLRDYIRECEDLVPAPIPPNPRTSLRPNPPTTKQPFVPRSPSRGVSPAGENNNNNNMNNNSAVNNNNDEDELDRLRSKLRAHSARCVAAPLSPEPPRGASAVVQGRGGGATFHRGTMGSTTPVRNTNGNGPATTTTTTSNSPPRQQQKALSLAGYGSPSVAANNGGGALSPAVSVSASAADGSASLLPPPIECAADIPDRPYEGVKSTIRPVEDDNEIEGLLYDMKAREGRMLRRKKALEAAWTYAGSKDPSTKNVIKVPESDIMFANDAEVEERAARLEAKEAAFISVFPTSINGEYLLISGSGGGGGGGGGGGSSPPVVAASRDFATTNKRPSGSQGRTTISPRASISLGASGHASNPNTFLKNVNFASSVFDPSSSVTSYDITKRRTSAMRVSDASMAILAAFDNELNVDIVMPGPEEIENERQGDVLGSKSILKRDLYDAAFIRRDHVGVMAGAPNFRIVPKFNVGGVAQAHASGIRAVLNEVRKVYNTGPIIWCTLREEPVLYLNGRSHIIRSVDHPLKPVAIVGITGERIATIEKKLKAEVLGEADHNGGNVCVHKETATGKIDTLWEAVEEESVATLVDVFEEMNQRGYDVRYVRHPIAQGVGPQPTDFQSVFELCIEYPHCPIIYNCQTGRGRSSMMMVISTIVKFYQFCQRDINIDVSLMNGDGAANSFRTILRLISLLPDGALHERRVAVLSELSDKIYSISAHVNALFKSREVDVNALVRLRQYAYLICFSCFCEAKMWTKAFKGSFVEWFEEYPEVKTLLHNMVQQSKHQAASERIETPVGEDHEVAAEVRRRRGNVLSSNMILRSQPKDQSTNQSQATINGVLALRQLCPDVPIFTCGRATEQGRNDLLYNIRLAFPQISGIQWISMRDEPMVFINGTGYSLLDYNVLQAESSETVMHIGAGKIEELEEKLVKDVLAEAELHKGYIIVHEMENLIDTVPKKIKVQSVHTPRSVMRSFSEKNNIKYIRMPMPVDWNARPEDFDALLEHVSNNIADDEAVVINDTDGGLRTTLVMNYIAIIRAARNGLLRELRTKDLLSEALMGHPLDSNSKFIGSTINRYHGIEEINLYCHALPELQIASQVCQMLAAGSLIYTTSAIIDLGGRGPEWNVLDALEVATNGLAKLTGEAKSRAQRKALAIARKYLMVLLCALYIDDQAGYNPDKPLSKWCWGLKEINHVLEKFDERPQQSLKFVLKDNLMEAHSGDRAIQRRTGEVLTANFVLKADHFKGCAKAGIGPSIVGAPNFRKVDFVNVYGVAIPTRVGVHNVLSALGALDHPMLTYPDRAEKNGDDVSSTFPAPTVFDAKFSGLRYAKPIRAHVIWVNLREEPFLYVGDRPFVFRDLAVPYVNVELTGIESQKVEHVENKLKQDILKEAQQYDGKFLVHDEGKGVGEIVGIWEEADNQTVTTVLELYEGFAQAGARVEFLRLPVTDEQSPELKDFDSLVLALLPRIRDASEPLSFVFNCQMGRGRTTTGMVICCLLMGLVYPDYYTALDQKHPKLYPEGASRFANGEYSCIVKLKAVLNDGRRAKHHTDLVLEACNRMQNLRTAIEDFRKASESVDKTEEERARAHHSGVHYLGRYLNLIAFASYLEESFDKESRKLLLPFADWMEGRPEIAAIHGEANLN